MRRLAVGVVAAVSIGGAGAAWGETVRDPSGQVTGLYLFEVGTNGSDASSGDVVAVSHGGCARGAVAVGIGDPNRSCFWQGDVEGQPVAVGLLGAESKGLVAVSDSGGATGWCLDVSLGCAGQGVGVSATGPASGLVAVSGTGTATSDTFFMPGTPSAAVSGTGRAEGHTVSVSGTGNAACSPVTTNVNCL